MTEQFCLHTILFQGTMYIVVFNVFLLKIKFVSIIVKWYLQNNSQRDHQVDIIYDNKTQLVEKGGSSFFFKWGVYLLKGGSTIFCFFDGGDYVAELVETPPPPPEIF